jgi:glycogen debranching enzyme
MAKAYTIGAGSPEPLGVTLHKDGANIAVVSQNAEQILLCLFDAEGEQEIARLALPNRSGDVHFGFVPALKAGMRYGLRAEGPFDPWRGHRFDPSKLLADPYARELDRPFMLVPELSAPREAQIDTARFMPKGIIRPASALAENASPAKRPSVIYELAIKAFSKRQPAIAEKLRGTAAALAEPALIDHLVKLGVDTIELMPVAAWIDERHLPPLRLQNAWGYNPVVFMAPDPRIAPGGLAELRNAVSALRSAGMQVVLDVVFNHTGESDIWGPTLSLRGLDNALYYRHAANGERVNDTGTGNTLACDRPAVVRLVTDAMRSWIAETGIDGFRFDLATILGRRDDGFAADAPLLTAIEQDTVLSKAIMIAEPWDIGPGGYKLGKFPPRWLEWNDRYRDDVRRFWRGDDWTIGTLATRIAGSADIFGAKDRPSASVNFIAAHDGFSLRDLVSYSTKHNDGNGEYNRDGTDQNYSWNRGIEGETSDVTVVAARKGDVRALLATLLLSRGTAMLTAGDEFGRTQGGNNNAYAQDNEVSWLDWNAADGALVDFTAKLIGARKKHSALNSDRFLTGLAIDSTGIPDVEWLTPDGKAMAVADWENPRNRVLGASLYANDGEGDRCCFWINGGNAPVDVSLPLPRDGFSWQRILSSNDDDTDGKIAPRSVTLYAEMEAKGLRHQAPDTLVAEVAVLAGIQPVWWTVNGERHDVTPETQRALLVSLGFPAQTASEARESLMRLRSRKAPGASLRGECHVDPAFAQGGKRFGLAAHLYCLRGEQPQALGNLATLRALCEETKRQGGMIAGINPLHHLFPTDRKRVSPYQPSDRRFIDPLYIDLEDAVVASGSVRGCKLLDENGGAIAALSALKFIDYEAAWRLARPVLDVVFKDFAAAGTSRAFEAYCKTSGDAVHGHCIFEAIADTFGTVDRARWPAELRERKSSRVTEFEKAHGDALRFRQWLQWIADRQLGEAVKDLANPLYRDLALGIAFDGGECWSDPEIFGNGVSIGAPPDPFSAQGQVWQLAPFKPHALIDRDYEPIRAILRSNMRHAGMLRIDHVLGLQRQFWVPQGAEGKDGAYVSFPLDDLLSVVAEESRAQRCMVVGEDLGTVSEDLRGRLGAAKLFSYKVLWFERDGEAFRKAESYPYMSVSCLGSHDLPTFEAWRTGAHLELDRRLGRAVDADAERHAYEHDKQQLGRLFGTDGDMTIAAHDFLAQGGSALALLQVDDLFQEIDQLNVPGTDREYPNWRRRHSRPIGDIARSPVAHAIFERMRVSRDS